MAVAEEMASSVVALEVAPGRPWSGAGGAAAATAGEAEEAAAAARVVEVEGKEGRQLWGNGGTKKVPVAPPSRLSVEQVPQSLV